MKALATIPLEEIASFCRRNHIRRLSLFGSCLGGSASPENDMDFLVEFDPVHVPGLIRLAGIEAELSGILGELTDEEVHITLDEALRNAIPHKKRTRPMKPSTLARRGTAPRFLKGFLLTPLTGIS